MKIILTTTRPVPGRAWCADLLRYAGVSEKIIEELLETGKASHQTGDATTTYEMVDDDVS